QHDSARKGIRLGGPPPRERPRQLHVRPGDSGVTNVELARAFTLWRTTQPDTLPRAIVLRAVREGLVPLELRFSSSEDVNPALRPKLRISYHSSVRLGLP